MLKEYKEAREVATEILSINPEYGEAYIIRGIADYKIKDYNSAIEDLLAAESKCNKEDLIEAYLYLSKAYLAQSDHESCLEYLEKCEKKEWLLRVAKILIKTEVRANISKALNLVNKLLAEEMDETVLALRGSIHSMLNNYKKAVEDFESAKLTKKDHYYHNAKCLIKLKQAEKALDILNIGIKIFPSYNLLLQERVYFLLYHSIIENCLSQIICSRRQSRIIQLC